MHIEQGKMLFGSRWHNEIRNYRQHGEDSAYSIYKKEGETGNVKTRGEKREQ